MNLSSFWLVGFMPVQLLLVLVVTFFAFIVGQHLLKRSGKPVPAFGQAVLIWLAAYGILKWVVWPPLPSSLLVIYMVLITVVVFLLISSTNRSWNPFKLTILNTLTGETRGYRIMRAATVLLIPIVAGIMTYHIVKPPDIEAPLELRAYHPAPPQSITVYPPEYFMKK